MPTRDAVAYAILTLLLLFVAVNLQAGWVYAVDALLVGFAIAGWVTTYAAVRPLPVSRSMPAEVVEGPLVQEPPDDGLCGPCPAPSEMGS